MGRVLAVANQKGAVAKTTSRGAGGVRSILTHAPRSAGAEGYRAIARILHEENR